MNRTALALIAVTVAVAGCTAPGLNGEQSNAGLIGTVSDGEVTNESAGVITLNARNDGNASTFYVELRPVGDYSAIIETTDRDGNEKLRFNLGEAAEGGTTGEKFAEVRKRLNVTATVRVQAELYREDDDDVLDTQVYRLKTIEE
jgi:hypothetical protein